MARSRLATAVTSSRPTPGQEKTLSTTTAPATRLPTMKPTIVTVATAALAKTRRTTTPPLQHRRAGEAGQHGSAPQAQGQHRQDGVLPTGIAAAGQPAQADGKDQHQHQSENEAGDGVAGDGQAHHAPIDGRIA